MGTGRFMRWVSWRAITLSTAALLVAALGAVLVFRDGQGERSGLADAAGPTAVPGSQTVVEERNPLLPDPTVAAVTDETVYSPDLRPTVDAGLRESDLVRHGVFRLIPGGYSGTLTYEEIPAPPPGAYSEDPAVVRTSPLFVEVPEIPASFWLDRMDTWSGGLNLGVRQVFVDGSGKRMIEVMRGIKWRFPIDVAENAPSAEAAGATLEAVLIGSSTGYIRKLPDAGIVDVVFFDEDSGIITHVRGDGVSAEVVERIARAIQEKGGV